MPSSQPSPTWRREKEVLAVGVDNGGTWIRLKGLDKNGRCVWSLKKPSPTVEKLPGFLKMHLRRFRGGLQGLAVGSRGVWKASKRRAVKHSLSGLAKNIVVMSDVEAAWMAAFGNVGAGHRPRPPWNPISGRHGGLPLQFSRSGIIVISGTGSIAYGRKADGTFARAGGLGPKWGDEGSGYWIGKEWLRRRSLLRLPSPPAGGERAWPLRPRGEGGAVRKTASLAPGIIRKAQNGNPLAREVIRAAHIYLGALLVELVRNLSWKGTIPISVSGSVLENAWFQRGFIKILRKNKVNFQFIRKRTDQAIAPLTHTLSPQGGRGEILCALTRSIMGHAID